MFMVYSYRKFSHGSHVVILHFTKSLWQIKEKFAQVRAYIHVYELLHAMDEDVLSL